MEEGRASEDEEQQEGGREATDIVLSDQNDARVARLIRNNPQTTKIDFCLDDLEDDQWEDTVNAVSTNPNLEIIILRHNSIVGNSSNAMPSVCRQMLQVLPVVGSLQVLCITGVTISADDLSNVIQLCNLKTLDLGECDLTGNTAALKVSIENNETITTFRLGWTIHDRFMMPFLTGLKSNVTVQEISIELSARLGEETIRAAIEMVERTKANKLACYGNGRMLQGLANNKASSDIHISHFDLNEPRQAEFFKVSSRKRRIYVA